MSSNSTADALAYRRNEDRARDGIPITIICPAVALILVALRLYTRAFLSRKVFLEDYTIIGAIACSIFLSIFIVIAFTNGAGRHFETVSPEEYSLIRRFGPAVSFGYNGAQTLVKMSIAFQYIRISVMPFERRLCYGLCAILVAGFIAFFIGNLVVCRPLYAVWTPNVPGAVCINVYAAFLGNQIYHIIMDFTILVGPFFILRHLSVPWPQKILLGVVLAFGAMASTVSILRLQKLKQSAFATDKTWDSVDSGLYGVIEINVAIICSCIVTLRPLFGRWRWLSNGGKKELPQAVAPREEPPRPKDPFSVGTDSTRVITVPDVELGKVGMASCDSTRVDSRTGGEDGDTVPLASATNDSDHPRSSATQPRDK